MELVFATNNKHKIREITDLLDDNFRILGLADPILPKISRRRLRPWKKTHCSRQDMFMNGAG
jgi:inosine/xanthosine triphosphate pyrophosphatase family protein